MKGWIAVIASALGAVVSLAAAPAAAGFGLSSPAAAPTDLQAGANSDLAIQVDVSEPGDQLRDLTIHLPPGLVGNPLATPRCSEEELNSAASGGAGCPPASAVGTVSNVVDLTLLDPLPLAIEQTVTGNVYNVAPRPGEPARFGIVLNALPFTIPLLGGAVLPPIVLQSPARLRESDFGLDTVLTDLPQSAVVVPSLGISAGIDIKSVVLNLAGEVGDPPQGFLRNPTSCTPAAISFDGRAWNGDTASGTAPGFTPTGCAAVPFTPELSARARPHGIGQPVELETTISQTPEEAGLAQAQVILPNGITGNNALLGTTCPRPDFEAGSCPPNTLIGTASASSPLQLQPLTGTVSLIEPAVPGLPDIGLDLRGPLALKLTGSLTLGTDGRAITTFARLPDIPIADFDLAFSREPGFVFAGRDLCTSPPLTVEGAFRAFSGAEASVQAPLELRGCGPAKARKPSASVKLSKADSRRPRLRFKVKAGSEPLRKARIKLPRGLSLAKAAKFKRGAKLEADGDALKGRRVKRAKRSLTLKAGGADRVRGKLTKGALRKRGKLGQRPKFRFSLTDTAGKNTRLVVRAK